MSPRRRVVVLGGGIAGLAAALELSERPDPPEVVLLEAADRLGGALRTEYADGYLLEHGADNFITNTPWAVQLCQRVGLGDQLLTTNHERRGAAIVLRGRVVPVPDGFMLMAPRRLWPMVTTPALSFAGKLRLFAEPLVKRRNDPGDESVAAFARRRLGRETYERLVQPLVGGIYTADAEKLSLDATMPRFHEMERQHGSLLRGMISGNPHPGEVGGSGARYGLFMAPRDGMQSLVDAIAARLPAGVARMNCPVERVRRESDGRWTVEYRTTADGTTQRVASDGLIVATNSAVAARLLSEVDMEISSRLAAIEHASSAVALVGCRTEQITRPVKAFGIVVPRMENLPILAVSFASYKFPGRAPRGHELLRVFIGGATQADLLRHDDATLQQLAVEQLRGLIGFDGAPEFSRVVRWTRAMPQYAVGHVARMNELERLVATYPGLALAGAAYRGVGIPDCVKSGLEAAERIHPKLAAS